MRRRRVGAGAARRDTGARRRTLDDRGHDHPDCASGQEGYALNRHLDTLAALRALPPGSSVQLQDTEREAMVEALGRDPATIEKRLVDRMHISRDEAARLRELIVPSAPPVLPARARGRAGTPARTRARARTRTRARGRLVRRRNFEETPSGPVDVFEELARLPEPAPLPHPGADTGSFPEAPSFRTAFPDPVEAVLVDAPATAAAAVVFAGDAPPIEVVGHGDAYSWSGAAWGGAPPDAATGGPNRTSDPLETREPTPWEPPPSAWDAQWASTEEPADAAPLRPVDDPHAAPVEIVEYVDEWIESPPPAPPAAVTTSGVEPVDGLGPWEHRARPRGHEQRVLRGLGNDRRTRGRVPGLALGPAHHARGTASTATSRITVDEAAVAAVHRSRHPNPNRRGSRSPRVATGADPDPARRIRHARPGHARPRHARRPCRRGRRRVRADQLATAGRRPAGARAVRGGHRGLGEHRHLRRGRRRTEPSGRAGRRCAVVRAAGARGRRGVRGRRRRVGARQRGAAGRGARPGRARDAPGRRALGARRPAPRRPTSRSRSRSTSGPGPGFGVLFRASTDGDGHMSGYSFDIDPIHEGGSYLVRQWHADRELWNPIARVAATDPGAMHGHLTLRVVVVDDTLTASVNGEHVLSVESLEPGVRRPQPGAGDGQPRGHPGVVVVGPRGRHAAHRRALTHRTDTAALTPRR